MARAALNVSAAIMVIMRVFMVFGVLVAG